MEPCKDKRQNHVLQIYTLNGNGNPAKLRLVQERIKELASISPLIGIFNDIRCQEAGQLRFDGFSTIVANDPNRRHFAGGSALIFPREWSAKRFDCPGLKEGYIIELTNEENQKVIVSTIYAHPGMKFPNQIIDKIRNINDKNDKSITISGDFNAPSIALGSRFDSNEGDDLIEKMVQLGMNYANNEEPTFINRANGNWNLLDMTFLSDKAADNFIDFSVDDPCESDHFATVTRIRLKGSSKRIRK